MGRIENDDYQNFQIERCEGEVLRITLDRPGDPLNAVNGELHEELARLFRELRQEDDARCVLLTGSDQSFSAGGDFNWFPQLQDHEALEHLRRDAKQLIWDLLDVELPIVVALNGHAIGLGASIALLSDVIFMAETATLADPHVRVGIVAGDGGAAIWPLVLGPARAKEFLMTGDPVRAEDAHRMGLVNHVVPIEELDSAALEFAKRLAQGAPLAIRYTKQAVNKLVKDALNTAYDFSTALEIVTFHSEDHREALTALAEKRPPRFKGR